MNGKGAPAIPRKIGVTPSSRTARSRGRTRKLHMLFLLPDERVDTIQHPEGGLAVNRLHFLSQQVSPLLFLRKVEETERCL